MDRRLQLQTLLDGIQGVKKAYFVAPPNDMMEYPCIIYNLDNHDIAHANNVPYRSTKRYQVTVIDGNPDSKIPDAVASLPTASFSTSFVANKLHHKVYTLYF